MITLKWIIKTVVPEHRTYDGILVEHQETESEIPFEMGADVYYVHRKNWMKRNSPYVISKSLVTGAWVTNTVGVVLGGCTHIAEDEFDRLFTDRDKAIDYCLKKNAQRKVKIYGE